MEYVSIRTALADFFSNTGRKEEVNEDNILQWASDCMEKIGNFRQYSPNITVLEVENFRAKLPQDFIATELMMFSYNTSTSCDDLTLQLSETITPDLEGTCNVTVSRTCNGCCGQQIVETVASDELVKSHPWIGYSRVVLTSDAYNKRYRNEFVPMKLSDKAAIKYHLTDCTNIITQDADILYTIKDGYIIVNEKSGKILLFYLGQVTDEEGYPMIPSRIEYLEAIYYYIEFKMAWADYVGEKSQGARLLFVDTQRLSNEAIARCIAKMNTPTWEEAIEISEMWRQRIPPTNLRGPNLNYNIERSKLVNNARYRSASTLFRNK